MNHVKKLRIIAGPNGSGKSTIVEIITNNQIHLGIYINADEINVELNSLQYLDFSKYRLTLDILDLSNSLNAGSFYSQDESEVLLGCLTNRDNRLYVTNQVLQDEKFPSFLADYIREQLLNSACDKFSFETVMSHPSKLEFIKLARSQGYRIYLYFVSLEDPQMNVERVEARVRQGGHDVPKDKIISRYERTMNYLLDAIRLVDRAYLFDNSSEKTILFAIYQSNEISLEGNDIPAWFQKYVLDKLND
jgi:predicted ABC-type ATPase